jgi:hypothetical protein
MATLRSRNALDAEEVDDQTHSSEKASERSKREIDKLVEEFNKAFETDYKNRINERKEND